LAIETVLVTEFVTSHREVALKGILIGAAPGMMDAHGVIGSDGTIEKRPFWSSRVLDSQLLKNVMLLPETKDYAFVLCEIDFCLNLRKRHTSFLLVKRMRKNMYQDVSSVSS
jgi:hypothetical protein